MLSISSTFHEIEKALQNQSIKDVKNEMSVGENKLRRVLTAAGYEYDVSSKKWRYVVVDEAKDLRDMSFWAFDEHLKGNTVSNMNAKASITSNTSNKKSNINITESNNTVKNSNIGNMQFSPEEVAVLKEMARLHLSHRLPIENKTILESIKAIKSDDTDRKTFVIDKQLITLLDEFCELHRVRKSDVMSVAIADLLQKYK